MAVCPVELHLHAIDVQNSVRHMDFTDSDLVGNDFARRLQNQRIKIRLLRIPQMGFLHFHYCLLVLYLRLRNTLSLSVKERCLNVNRLI